MGKSMLHAALQYICGHTFGSCPCRSYLCCACGKKRDYYYEEIGDENDLKKLLQIHFMSPFQKWNFKEQRRFPWKLMVQIITIVLVTIQLIFFARTKFFVTDFVNENSHTFSKLFVANLVDSADQTDPIPSPIAYLYTLDEVLDQITYTANAYYDLQNRAVGRYGYEWVDSDLFLDNDVKVMRQLPLKVTKYGNGKIDPTYLSIGIKEPEIDHYSIYEEDLRNPNRSIADSIMWSKHVEEINVIEKIDMELKISSVSIVDGPIDSPRCFQFTVLVGRIRIIGFNGYSSTQALESANSMDDSSYACINLQLMIGRDYDSGSMPLTLKIQETLTRECQNESTVYLFDTSFDSSKGIITLDGLVITISSIFIFLSGRSLFNTFILASHIKKYLKPRMNKFSSVKILKPLFDTWHVLVIVSNILTVIGSILKLLLVINIIDDVHVVDGTSIILGLAVFGQWCGLLRFLSYFDKYNMLLKTLKISAPNVIRFVVCTGILYIAFLLCGWLVMGPYHPKFRTFFLSSECLFSLINGDDMYNTYILASNSSMPVLIFSKIYLYIFVALFIYVVLSVFISLIEDTYRTLHGEWLDQKREQSAADDHVASTFLHDFAEGRVNIPVQMADVCEWNFFQPYH